MGLKVLVAVCAIVTIAGSIPMPFRNEVPADEFIAFAPYRDDLDNKDYRLPNNTRPVRYDVTLTTDVHQGAAAFNGHVRIRFTVLVNSDEITLHQRQLTIDKIDLYSFPDSPFLLQSNVPFSEVDDVEFLVIKPTDQINAGQDYIVDITYHGLLRDDNMGFYRSTYKNPQGQTVWLATTQFEQTDARHAFPCYDEPQIRAVFGISIRHNIEYSAISNMLAISTLPVPSTSYVETKFQDTLPVQSYLIAFIVSDFENIQNAATIRQRVFAKRQSIDNGEAALALDAGQKILDAFQTHLGVPYTLPKMDQVAVPDFDAGAMENWGLVTYREEYLLYNEETATTRQRENILTIIAHEYAHQWFGNHVSPKWWSYLWLNEGFATLYENYLASLVYPDDRLMDTFVVDTVQSVLDTDANSAIRPMTYYVENPERISGLFDRVAYDKSGSVLRMMQVALSVPTWTKGLRYYLETNEYKSAGSDELYAGLQQAVNEDVLINPPSVSTIMSTWENQAGYPVITVSRTGNQLKLTQDRFFYTEETSSNLWWVPINYVVGSNPVFTDTNPDLWLAGEKEVTIESATAPKPWTTNDWIVVNIQETSYYRVNYDDNLWNLLIQQLNGNNFDQIHVLNRAQLVDDSLNLARAGKISYDVPFGILEYLIKESDYIPWASANRGMTLLNRWLSGSPSYESYQAFVKKIVEPLYNRLGVEVDVNDPKLDRYARSIAINLACQAGLESCLTQTSQKLQQIVNTTATIAPDLQSAIYCNGLRQADVNTYFFLQNKMLNSEDQAERTLIIASLGCSQDAALLTQLLNLAIIPGDVLRLQEKFRVLVAPVNNGELGLRVMMDFIRYNFESILAVSATQVNTMLSNIASRVASVELSDKFDALLAFLEGSGIITEANRISFVASTESNLDWQTKNSDQINDFFQVEGETSTVLSTTTNGGTGDPSTTETGGTEETTSTIVPPTTGGAGAVMVSTIAITFFAFIKYLL